MDFNYYRKTQNPRCLKGFWICQGSEYDKCYDYTRVTQDSEYVWVIPEYAWLTLHMSEYARMSVNISKSASVAYVLSFLFPHCNSLSTWMRGY